MSRASDGLGTQRPRSAAGRLTSRNRRSSFPSHAGSLLDGLMPQLGSSLKDTGSFFAQPAAGSALDVHPDDLLDHAAGKHSGVLVPPAHHTADESGQVIGLGGIGVNQLAEWRAKEEQDPVAKLARTVLMKTDLSSALSDPLVAIHDHMVFNIKVDLPGDVVTNQMESGRCWLFALTNVCRRLVARELHLMHFQLSQSYLFVMDHLSKANWFLEQVLDLADVPLVETAAGFKDPELAFANRELNYLFQNGVQQDGGQYDCAVNLVLTYGLVPQAIYPESHNSSHTEDLDKLLTTKLRGDALLLRKKYKALRKAGDNHEDAVIKIRDTKSHCLEEVYRILCATCGPPPHPNEAFVWEYYDLHGDLHAIESTPREFAAQYLLRKHNLAETISLTHDPRHALNECYTVRRLGNVVLGSEEGVRPIRYLNVESNTLKQVTIDCLKNGLSVWFGCDVDQASNLNNGVMDLKIRDFETAFGIRLPMTKKERLQTGESSLTHAMTFTGVHLDHEGKPVRWRVENSWGPDKCNRGFLVMSDAWFDEFVMQVAAPKKYIDPRLVRIYEGAKVTELSAWDPMGSLA